MALHIGNRIQEVLDISGISRTEFAKKINKSRANLYDMFKRASMNTADIKAISKALRHNFFWDIARDVDMELSLQPPISNSDEPDLSKEMLTVEVEYLRKTLTLMKQENDQLKRLFEEERTEEN